ncbi:hypothetical protein [Cysteiniphilum sp. QT6929]|nr:hypothetical protein [Cysteiniphilum sp. QT6929]WHN65053.1 hypothetical protein NYP54_08360 [Cysteiniphilum sp. QT6929]
MWSVITTDLFDDWYDTLDDTDRSNVLASMIVLYNTPRNLNSIF